MLTIEQKDANKWLDVKIKYIKKQIPVRAAKIKEEFSVSTKEGTMKGKAGDYLIEGVKGELYCCDKEIFNLTYEPAQ